MDQPAVFTHIYPLLILTILSYVNSQQEPTACDKFYCSKEESTYCMRRYNDTVMVYNYKACSAQDVCIVDSLFNGICLLGGDTPQKIAYPGEPCTNHSECPFGPQTCDSESGQCQGFNIGSRCKISPDCNPEMYCQKGRCINTLKIGDNCDETHACGHNAFCYFEDPFFGIGVCIKYMSLPVGQPAAKRVVSTSGLNVCKI